jgi:hypothetical protein
MSTTQITTTTPATATAGSQAASLERLPVWKHGIVASVAASVSTTVLAAVASAAGVSFSAQHGARIPIAGFSELTLVFSLVGVALAAVLARRARRPRSAFVRTTSTLTVLSYIPDLTSGFDRASTATLITLHTIAAAIVIPTLAGRLARTR